jgi:hypothetical protein
MNAAASILGNVDLIYENKIKYKLILILIEINYKCFFLIYNKIALSKNYIDWLIKK